MVRDHGGVEDSAGKEKPAEKGRTAAASALVRLNPTKLCPEGGTSLGSLLPKGMVPIRSCNLHCLARISVEGAPVLSCFLGN